MAAEKRISYVPWDFKRCAKRRGGQILSEISPCIKESLQRTGMFVCAPSNGLEKDKEGLEDRQVSRAVSSLSALKRPASAFLHVTHAELDALPHICLPHFYDL